MRREWVRFRAFLGSYWARLHWVPEAIAMVLAALVVSYTLSRTWRGADWPATFRSQALNIAFGILLASFAYLLYFLRFRQAQLNRYLERSRLARSRLQEDADPLAETIVEELLDARPPHACLIKGPAGAEDPGLLADVAGRLASRHWPANRVPVVVDVGDDAGNSGLPSLTRERFVTQLVGSSGDEASAKRLFASMVKKEKVVALIEGLDRVGLGTPLVSRRATLAKLLEGSLAEGIPFVAWVSEDLAPSISEVAAFRAGPMRDGEFRKHICQRVQPGDGGRERDSKDPEVFRAAFDEVEPTRDLALVHLALDVLDRRTRSGANWQHAAADLFSDRCIERRHLRWMCFWTLGVGLDEISGLDSPALIALAAIGKGTHFLREPELGWNDASRDLDADAKLRFAAGVTSLAQRNVLTISGSGSGAVIRFTHPMWFAFAGALGLKLDKDLWRDLLQPGVPIATIDALTGALLIFGPRTASFVRELEQIGIHERSDISLEMVRAVILALQADGEPLDIGRLDLQVLQESWSAASDVNRLRFVSAVGFHRDPMLIDFLWRQVVPPHFDVNRFRVRRAICTRLGQLGKPAWEVLNAEWHQRVSSADGEALTVSSRNTLRWKEAENPLASLGWVLPGLLLTIDEQNHAAYELLRQLRAVQVWEGADVLDAPDIGMEISLAEGFKAAAVETFTKRWAGGTHGDGHPYPPDDRWWKEGLDLLETSRSWISKQALVQALALARPIAPDDIAGPSMSNVFRAWDSDRSHPFVRETARLVSRALGDDAVETSKDEESESSPEKDSRPLPEVDVWFEAVESLEDGGVTLSPDAHQLLGLSTLLINLAERRVDAIDDERRDAALDTEREQALAVRECIHTAPLLPGCFRQSRQAATMHKVPCKRSCRFSVQLPNTDLDRANLCGEAAMADVLNARRSFSRSFLQRAQVTARSAPSGPRWLPRVIRRAWHALTRPDRSRLASTRAFGSIWKLLDTDVRSREEGQ